MHGALIYALDGEAGRRRAVGASGGADDLTGTLDDGNTMAGTWPTSAPCSAATGPTRCAEDAQTALAGLGPLSPYRAAMLHAVGAADLLEGDLDRADVNFAGARRGDRAVVVPFVPLGWPSAASSPPGGGTGPRPRPSPPRRWRS